MAIRGPKPNEVQHSPVAQPRQQPASPLQRLVDFGSARTPQEAKKLAGDLLAGLRAAGFPVAKTGNADGELAQALKLFQKENGLPQSGVLDKDTHQRLVDDGHLPSTSTSTSGVNDAGAAAPVVAPKDPHAQFDPGGRRLGGEFGLPQQGSGGVPDGAKAPHAVEIEQAVDKSARDKPPELDMKSFLASLRSAGFPGGGKGAEQLKDALKKLQKAEGLPQSGSLDAKTADALVRRGIVDARALPVTSTSETQQHVDARVASDARTADARTTDARSDPSTRGAASPAANADVFQGRAADAAKSDAKSENAASTQAQAQSSASNANTAATAKDAREAAAGADRNAPPSASSTSAAPSDASAHDDAKTGDEADPWSEGKHGNAPAGDDDVDDARRGHTNRVDDEDAAHEQGHWEVESLIEQISAGLAAIVRDDDGSSAATYAWDFTLYRPGIYGAKQPAEKLFHLVVKEAGAFDELWEKARVALNDKLAALEPDSPRVDAADFASALRVARYRD